MSAPAARGDHPFAQYIRILGVGPGRSRSLTEDEAYQAMCMIRAGEVQPVQLGALLMLMRYKRETAEELAGFARALQTAPGPAAVPDLNWPSYAAGRTRGLAWYVLSALLLAHSGIRIVMHGLEAKRSATARALASLGIAPCASMSEAASRLEAENFAYLPASVFCPTVHEILGLRPLLGLRSPANSLARLLNPFGAPCLVAGVFHPAYRELQQGAAHRLGMKSVSVIKGGGGEFERNPAKACRVAGVRDGVLVEEEWPALAKADDEAETEDDAALLACWRGALGSDHAEGVVVATAALALATLGRVREPESADRLAREMWRARDKGLLPRGRIAGDQTTASVA
jgi:anthranilate phosphoribosyltransferase